jgi:hypothetical protein
MQQAGYSDRIPAALLFSAHQIAGRVRIIMIRLEGQHPDEALDSCSALVIRVGAEIPNEPPSPSTEQADKGEAYRER